MILLKNANVLTMAGQDYPSGDVLIEGAHIKAVGQGLAAPANAQVIDCTGKTVLPGFIDAHCRIGLSEDGTMYEGEDADESVNPVTPHLRALDGINPADIAIQEAALGGVTTVCVGPGNKNVFGGIMSVFKTYGARIDDMIIKEVFAVKAALGEPPKATYTPQKIMPMTRMGIAALMRENLTKARIYMEKRERLAGQKECPATDLCCEALGRLLRKEIPMVVHANRMDDIYTALRIAKEFDLDIILSQGAEAHRMTDVLREAGVPVILGSILNGRMAVEEANMSHAASVVLEEAGVEYCLSTNAPPVPIQFLPTTAGCAVREGLSKEAALRAITITPAKLLGIADRVGSIEPGKDADIVVYDGNPFNLMSKISLVLIDGAIISQ